MQKLVRINLMGLAHPITLLVPSSVMVHLSTLCGGYGALIKPVAGKKKKGDKLCFFIEHIKKAKKIWHTKRFDGTYFLSKRFYRKMKGGKEEYDGHAKVVVTQNTPIKLEYNYAS